jgi:hypothetical protein
MSGESKTSPRRIEAVEKQRKALDLRKAGATYAAVKAALNATVKDAADDVRNLEVERLDAMLLNLWPQVQKANQGAVDRVLRIMERRAKLLGLDAPVKTDNKLEIFDPYSEAIKQRQGRTWSDRARAIMIITLLC